MELAGRAKNIRQDIQTAYDQTQKRKGFAARFKGSFLYLDRTDRGRPSEICRLTWNGKMDNWGFAIYRYSRNFYDPDEWMFPGANFVNGTVEGAMKAGMEAYPM